MDAFDPRATTPEAFQGGTAKFRTDLYVAKCAPLLTHAESIRLIDGLGLKFTPELKEPSVPMPFDGDYSQERYAQQLIEEYVAAGIAPSRVFAQSFRLADVQYWLAKAPAFGHRPCTSTRASPEGYAEAVFEHAGARAKGVRIVAPRASRWSPCRTGRSCRPIYAHAARALAVDLITGRSRQWLPDARRGLLYSRSRT